MDEARARFCAVQSVLERNALLVAALNGHAHRRGDPASPQAQALREELKANLVHLMRANQPGFAEEQRRPFERGDRTSSGEVLSFLPPLPPPAPPAPPPPPEMPLLQLRPKLQPGEVVRLLCPLDQPPADWTGVARHKLKDAEGVSFFGEALVRDHDSEGARPFHFHLDRRSEGIGFNIGKGKDGTPLLSYSLPLSFYSLPDGSAWCEHTNLYDPDDLRAIGKARKLSFKGLADGMQEDEVVFCSARHHTRLAEAELPFCILTTLEYDTARYNRELPEDKQVVFAGKVIDMVTLKVIGRIGRAWEVVQ